MSWLNAPAFRRRSAILSPGSLSYTVTGLLDNTKYDVQVRAVNDRGGGAWSGTVVAETLPNRAPLPVGSLVGPDLQVGDASLRVTIVEADASTLSVEAAEAPESGGTVTLVVRLNRDPERDLDIDLVRTHHGGATDADYSGVPDRVAFGLGVRPQEFLFAATDDTADDDGEAVVLSFGSLPSRVTGSGETTLAIGWDGEGVPERAGPAGAGEGCRKGRS